MDDAAYANDVAYKLHFEMLGRVQAIETSLRLLLVAIDDKNMIRDVIRQQCAVIAEDARRKNGVAGDATARGMAISLEMILDDI